MGTKQNPGQFDCYANAKDDEPMFVLLGRDKRAPGIVNRWAEAYKESKLRLDKSPFPKLTPEQEAKYQEARQCAKAMIKWQMDNPNV